MRKILLFAATLICAASMNSQTIGVASVSIKNCHPTAGAASRTIYRSQLAGEGYTWNNATFTAADFPEGTYTVTKQGTIKRSAPKAACDSIVTMTVTLEEKPARPKEGAAWGVFSVASNKQVYFAQGNLQYCPNTSTYRFAENQYDYIGADNTNMSNPSYTGWIDYFTQSDAIASHTISNGGSATWYALTKDEWTYMFYGRDKGMSKYGFTTLYADNEKTSVYARGVIILPDTWTQPSNIDALVPGISNVKLYLQNEYSLTEWSSLELNGAIFIPAGGYMYLNNVQALVGDAPWGYSWSSTTDYALKVYANEALNANPLDHSTNKASVRLVQTK